MITSGELERVSMALDEPMKELEMRIMQDVVRRIKINFQCAHDVALIITDQNVIHLSRPPCLNSAFIMTGSFLTLNQ